MDFELNEEQKMLRTMVRDFADKELEPIAAQIDEEATFPADSVKKMAGLGLMGVPFPEEYGGSGGGPLEFVIVEEEIARVCAATGVIYLVTSGLAGQPLHVRAEVRERDAGEMLVQDAVGLRDRVIERAVHDPLDQASLVTNGFLGGHIHHTLVQRVLHLGKGNLSRRAAQLPSPAAPLAR